jgi:hypothetical protein
MRDDLRLRKPRRSTRTEAASRVPVCASAACKRSLIPPAPARSGDGAEEGLVEPCARVAVRLVHQVPIAVERDLRACVAELLGDQLRVLALRDRRLANE